MRFLFIFGLFFLIACAFAQESTTVASVDASTEGVEADSADAVVVEEEQAHDAPVAEGRQDAEATTAAPVDDAQDATEAPSADDATEAAAVEAAEEEEVASEVPQEPQARQLDEDDAVVATTENTLEISGEDELEAAATDAPATVEIEVAEEQTVGDAAPAEEEESEDELEREDAPQDRQAGAGMMNMAPVIEEITVDCNPDRMTLSVATTEPFGGKIYPKGFYKQSECVNEYRNQESPVELEMTFDQIDSCGMAYESGDDEAAFSTTVVVQPHGKLVTMMARAFEVRCKYDYRGERLTDGGFTGLVQDGLNVSMIGTVWEDDGFSLRRAEGGITEVDATAAPPSASLTIYLADSDSDAENVNIGDLLEMRVVIDDDSAKDTYGLYVRSCVVDDTMGMDSQQLIDEDGCVVEPTLFPVFNYNNDMTQGISLFKAHKFPYTATVNYVCYVDFCFKHDNGCADFQERIQALQAGACPREIEDDVATNRTRRSFDYIRADVPSSRTKRQAIERPTTENEHTMRLRQAIMVVDPRHYAVEAAEEAPLTSSLSNIPALRRAEPCVTDMSSQYTLFAVVVVLFVFVLFLTSMLVFVMMRRSSNVQKF